MLSSPYEPPKIASTGWLLLHPPQQPRYEVQPPASTQSSVETQFCLGQYIAGLKMLSVAIQEAWSYSVTLICVFNHCPLVYQMLLCS